MFDDDGDELRALQKARRWNRHVLEMTYPSCRHWELVPNVPTFREGPAGRSVHFMPIPRAISFFSVANKGIHSMGERPLVNACRPRDLRTLSPHKRRQMCTYKPLGTRSRGQNRRLLSQRACRLRAARLETCTRAHPHNQVTRREATALET